MALSWSSGEDRPPWTDDKVELARLYAGLASALLDPARKEEDSAAIVAEYFQSSGVSKRLSEVRPQEPGSSRRLLIEAPPSLPQLHIQAASASDDAMMHTPAPTVMTASHSSPRRDISTLNVSAPELPTVSTQDVAPDRADSVATGSPSPDFGSTQPATNGKKRKRVSDVDISLDSTALPTPLAGSKRQRTSPTKKASVAQEVTMDVDSHSTISPLVPAKPAKLIKPRKSREVADLESLAKAFEDQDNSLASAKLVEGYRSRSRSESAARTGTPASLADVDEPTYSVTGRRRRATRKDPLEPPDPVDSPAFSLYKSPLVQEAIEPLDESTPAPSVRPTNDDTNVHTADDVIPPDEVQRASVQEPVAESLPVVEAPALLRIKIPAPQSGRRQSRGKKGSGQLSAPAPPAAELSPPLTAPPESVGIADRIDVFSSSPKPTHVYGRSGNRIRKSSGDLVPAAVRVGQEQPALEAFHSAVEQSAAEPQSRLDETTTTDALEEQRDHTASSLDPEGIPEVQLPDGPTQPHPLAAGDVPVASTTVAPSTTSSSARAPNGVATQLAAPLSNSSWPSPLHKKDKRPRPPPVGPAGVASPTPRLTRSMNPGLTPSAPVVQSAASKPSEPAEEQHPVRTDFAEEQNVELQAEPQAIEVDLPEALPQRRSEEPQQPAQDETAPSIPPASTGSPMQISSGNSSETPQLASPQEAPASGVSAVSNGLESEPEVVPETEVVSASQAVASCSIPEPPSAILEDCSKGAKDADELADEEDAQSTTAEKPDDAVTLTLTRGRGRAIRGEAQPRGRAQGRSARSNGPSTAKYSPSAARARGRGKGRGHGRGRGSHSIGGDASSSPHRSSTPQRSSPVRDVGTSPSSQLDEYERERAARGIETDDEEGPEEGPRVLVPMPPPPRPSAASGSGIGKNLKGLLKQKAAPYTLSANPLHWAEPSPTALGIGLGLGEGVRTGSSRRVKFSLPPEHNDKDS